MILSYNSFRHPVMLKVIVETRQPVDIRVQVRDPERPKTFYMDRYKTVTGVETFYIRMPKSPQLTQIRIINKERNNDEGFRIVKTKDGNDLEPLPLKTKMSLFDFKDKLKASFIKFAEQISDRAGYLSPGLYYSEDSKFQIEFLPTIVDNGRELNTPARINSTTGQIQVSKKQFEMFTIPGRFAILLHEFCHVFAGGGIKDDIEADFHAAQIYLALGYPRIELLNVFGTVFLGADNDLNRKRFDNLRKYVENFDNNINEVKYN
jgi:hypothetical protein